jgi:putative oxidoreductase
MRHLKSTGRAALWTLQILAAVGFVLTGLAKFRAPFWIAGFARWGYPDGFRIAIGVLEVAGGVLLLFPRTSSYAAALLGSIMIGAVVTLLLHHEPFLAPVVWGAVLAVIGGVRRPRAARPASRAVPPTLDPV